MPDQLGDPPATLGMGQQAQQLELVAQVAVAVVVVEVVRHEQPARGRVTSRKTANFGHFSDLLKG